MELKKYCEVKYIRPDDIEDAQEFASCFYSYNSEEELEAYINKEYDMMKQEGIIREGIRVEHRIKEITPLRYIDHLEACHTCSIINKYIKDNKQYREAVRLILSKGLDNLTPEDHAEIKAIKDEEYIMALINYDKSLSDKMIY